MMHFWDKSTTFKVYFSKKLVKKTKNWMNLQIKRYSISSRLLTDFPPFPILPSTTNAFDSVCFHLCSTFWSFYNPAENDESFTQNDFEEFYYFYICFYRAVNFFFVVSRIWFILTSECALRFEPATSKNISDLILNSYRSLHSCLCFEYLGLRRKW